MGHALNGFEVGVAGSSADVEFRLPHSCSFLQGCDACNVSL